MGLFIFCEFVDIRTVVCHHLTYIYLRFEVGEVNTEAIDVVVDAVEHLLAVGIADREQHVLCSLWEGSHEAVFLSIVAYLGLVQRGIVHCCTFGVFYYNGAFGRGVCRRSAVH